YPERLDLNDVHARMAKERGVALVIDTDAHSIHQLEYMPYGGSVARRAGVTRVGRGEARAGFFVGGETLFSGSVGPRHGGSGVAGGSLPAPLHPAYARPRRH